MIESVVMLIVNAVMVSMIRYHEGRHVIYPTDLPLLGNLWQILVHYRSAFTPMVYFPGFLHRWRLLLRDVWTRQDPQTGLLGRRSNIPFCDSLLRQRHRNQSLHYLCESFFFSLFFKLFNFLPVKLRLYIAFYSLQSATMPVVVHHGYSTYVVSSRNQEPSTHYQA